MFTNIKIIMTTVWLYSNSNNATENRLDVGSRLAHLPSIEEEHP